MYMNNIRMHLYVCILYIHTCIYMYMYMYMYMYVLHDCSCVVQSGRSPGGVWGSGHRRYLH